MEILKTLGLNVPDFLWHTANFIVLVFLLSRFLFKPAIAMLEARQRTVRESMEQAERIRQEAERADAERTALLAGTRREVQDMLAQATAVAERIQAEARADAQQQAQRIIERSEQEALADRAQSMADLRREVAGLAVLAAERIIRRSLDDQAHRQLVEDFLAESAPASGS